jgi:hypothetical protein
VFQLLVRLAIILHQLPIEPTGLLDLVHTFDVLVADLLEAEANWRNLLDKCATGQHFEDVRPYFVGNAQLSTGILNI